MSLNDYTPNEPSVKCSPAVSVGAKYRGMHHSPPPKPAAMLGLAALAVELPFLVTYLLVQVLKQCPHCRHEWLSWPILPGAFPWFFGTFSLKIIPRDLSIIQVKFGWAVFTACLTGLIFAVSRRSALWRQLIAVGFVVSSGLAFLAFLLIAA
jgi:hypothetical protein